MNMWGIQPISASTLVTKVKATKTDLAHAFGTEAADAILVIPQNKNIHLVIKPNKPGEEPKTYELIGSNEIKTRLTLKQPRLSDPQPVYIDGLTQYLDHLFTLIPSNIEVKHILVSSSQCSRIIELVSATGKDRTYQWLESQNNHYGAKVTWVNCAAASDKLPQAVHLAQLATKNPDCNIFKTLTS